MPHNRDADDLEGRLDEAPDCVGLAGGHHVVVGRHLLHHHPHHQDVITRVAPVALGVNIAHVQRLLHALVDARHAARHLARDKSGAAAGRLVVKQDAVARMHAVGLPVVDHDPVRVQLRRRVRRPRVEGRRFALRHLLDEAEQLARRGLVEAGLLSQTRGPDGVQQSQSPQAVRVGRVLGHLKRHLDVTLRAEIVALVRTYLRYNFEAVGRVC
mmetsp:Transcript_29708/g.95952  ORF Transcript_29708/g.95952 Transcript_29708/m.95952 type:complete len:213 (+) Transcript_29708:401-1039(+)